MRIRRPSKYRAQPVVIDNVRFHSKREANRYLELKLLQRAGRIRDLELQPRFPLYAPLPGGGHLVVGEYRGDFQYYDHDVGLWIVEDVKSPPTRTALYRWKKKHVEIQYQIEITEV